MYCQFVLLLLGYQIANMSGLFGKKPTTDEVVKQQKRQMNRTNRDLERDMRQLERQEKQLELEIKKMAKQGNKQAATQLAKNLIAVRKQKSRNLGTQSKVTGIGHQMTAMNANVKMAKSMGTATKAMGTMNKQIDPMTLQKTLQEFEKESAKMGMAEEMMGDTLDDLLGGSDDEEEQDAIVNQVLDEIGIEITGKMASAPAAGSSKLPQASKASSSKMSDEDREIEDMLSKLKASS